MADTRLNQIVDAAATALEGVLVGAGYWTDLGLNVSRRRFVLQELPTLNMPAASVWAGDTVTSTPCMGGGYRDRVDLLVEVFYRAPTRETVERDGNRVLSDVRKAMLSTAQLGLAGIVLKVEPAEVKTDAQQFNDEKLGWKVLGFVVDYNWTASSP